MRIASILLIAALLAGCGYMEPEAEVAILLLWYDPKVRRYQEKAAGWIVTLRVAALGIAGSSKHVVPGGDLPLELNTRLSTVPFFCWESVLTRAYKTALFINSIDSRAAPRSRIEGRDNSNYPEEKIC